jgi:hypothetical protein
MLLGRPVALVPVPAPRPQPAGPPRSDGPGGVRALALHMVPDNRFSVRDRIALTQWSASGARTGVTRVRLEEPEPHDDPQVGSFALIYRDGGDWATWGVAREGREAYIVWRMATGALLGTARSLAAALELLLTL